jgi:hypothetical protein
MKVKTLCLASNVMLCCKDEDCGYIDVSELPATAEIATVHPVNNKFIDREKSTDFAAVNTLYVHGFLSCGDGGTEAQRLLGLLGLPNVGIIEEWLFSQSKH